MATSDAEEIRRLRAENLILRERLQVLEAAVVPETSSPTTPTPDDFAQAVVDAVPVSRFAIPAPDQYDSVPTFPERPHFNAAPRHPGTECVHFDGCPNDPYHPASMPIYQTATFVQPNISEFGPYDYTRSGNPTRTAAEVLVAKLEGAHSAFAFTSGMAALSCLMATLSSGDHILAMSDLYGGTHRLMTQITSRFGITVTFVDTSAGNVEEALEAAHVPGKTKLIHVESPSNPLMKVSDLRLLSAFARRVGARVSVDSTMMTPVRCQPLQLGCDVVMHSGTKFFSGHSDTMSGFLVVKDPDLARRIAFLQNAEGTALAPFDCWLILRGLKTLALRVDRQEANAVAVALFLCRETRIVRKVHFAGIDPRKYPDRTSLDERQYTIHHGQTSGPGSVISFETGDAALSKRFVDACELFKLTVSFGSCNSLVEMPCLLSHASIPKDKRVLPDDLIRLSIGIEHIKDLILDLEQAIEKALAGA